MTAWSVQDAKARFSEFLDTCLSSGPQIVTKRGVVAAVLVPADDWQRLQNAARPSLKTFLLTDMARSDIEIPKRGQLKRRKPAVVG